MILFQESGKKKKKNTISSSNLQKKKKKEEIDKQLDLNANRVIWQAAMRQTICLHAEE